MFTAVSPSSLILAHTKISAVNFNIQYLEKATLEEQSNEFNCFGDGVKKAAAFGNSSMCTLVHSDQNVTNFGSKYRPFRVSVRRDVARVRCHCAHYLIPVRSAWYWKNYFGGKTLPGINQNQLWCLNMGECMIQKTYRYMLCVLALRQKLQVVYIVLGTSYYVGGNEKRLSSE